MTTDTDPDDKSKPDENSKSGDKASTAGDVNTEAIVAQVKPQIRGELKDELGQWMQHRFWLITIIAAFAAIVGVQALVTLTVSGLVEKELEDREKDLNRLTNRIEKSSDDAAARAADATQIAKDAKSQIELMEKDVDAALALATAAVDEAVADAKRAGEIARQAADEARAAMATAREVQSQLASEASPGALTDKDREAIQILQKLENREPADQNGREWRTLSFMLGIDASVADTPEGEILDRVQRVEYLFDASKFANPLQTVENRAMKFRVSVRVFGITKVTALIYLTDPDEVVERSGFMDIFATEPTPLE